MTRTTLCLLLLFTAQVGCARSGQVPTNTVASTETAPPAAMPPVASNSFTALPDSAFRVQWVEHSLAASVPASGELRGSLTIRNTGDRTWPNIDVTKTEPRGAGAVRVGFRWKKSEKLGPNEGYAPERIELPRSMNPGETAQLQVSVKAPSVPGTYELEFDLVQELVSWFQAKGAETLTVRVQVTP